MSVKVKICGIRTIAAAKAAINAGADFSGFNFVPTSKRFIDPDKALKIIKVIKGKIKIVGVFQNERLEKVNQLVKDLQLDFVQLHGQENNDYINKVGLPAIKAVRIDDKVNLETPYILIDRNEQGKGQMINLEKAAKLAVKFPIFLAGGLTPDNVAAVIKQVKPFAVDVAGGIETDGRQDLQKIKEFVKKAKEAR